MARGGSVVSAYSAELSEKQASEQVSKAKEDEDDYRDHRRYQPHHVEKL